MLRTCVRFESITGLYWKRKANYLFYFSLYTAQRNVIWENSEEASEHYGYYKFNNFIKSESAGLGHNPLE